MHSHQFPRIIAFDRIPPSRPRKWSLIAGGITRTKVLNRAWETRGRRIMQANWPDRGWNYRLLSQHFTWRASRIETPNPFFLSAESLMLMKGERTRIENHWPSLWKMAACLTVSASRLGHGRIANTGRWILCNWGYLDIWWGEFRERNRGEPRNKIRESGNYISMISKLHDNWEISSNPFLFFKETINFQFSFWLFKKYSKPLPSTKKK